VAPSGIYILGLSSSSALQPQDNTPTALVSRHPPCLVSLSCFALPHPPPNPNPVPTPLRPSPHGSPGLPSSPAQYCRHRSLPRRPRHPRDQPIAARAAAPLIRLRRRLPSRLSRSLQCRPRAPPRHRAGKSP
jgi:hypothetical protein